MERLDYRRDYSIEQLISIINQLISEIERLEYKMESLTQSSHY